MKSLFKKIIGRRARRIYVWTAIVAVSVIVLAYQIAKFRGASAWDKAQARLETEGETWTLTDLVPEAVSASENFFGTPALADVALPENEGKRALLRKLYRLTDDPDEALTVPEDAEKVGAHDGRARDFGTWLEYARILGATPTGTGHRAPNAAEDSEAAQFLEAFDSVNAELIAELVTAAEREHARITPGLDQMAGERPLFEIQLPHYPALRWIAKGFALRAGAAAQSGDGGRTAESVAVLARVGEGCRRQPLLIGLFVSTSIDSMATTGIWEGLNARALDAGQLKRVQQLVEKIDMRQAYLSALRGEVLGALDIINYIQEEGYQAFAAITAISDSGKPAGSSSRFAEAIVPYVMPSGWLDQNRATYANWVLDYAILPARNDSYQTMIAKAAELENLIAETRPKLISEVPHRVIALISMPVVTQIARKMMYAEARRVLALSAIAVELYYLENGSYPDRIEQLVPETLGVVPEDPGDGKSIRYRREGDRYLLWSVGVDGEDDGGMAGEDGTRSKDYDGDWLWRYSH